MNDIISCTAAGGGGEVHVTLGQQPRERSAPQVPLRIISYYTQSLPQEDKVSYLFICQLINLLPRYLRRDLPVGPP